MNLLNGKIGGMKIILKIIHVLFLCFLIYFGFSKIPDIHDSLISNETVSTYMLQSIEKRVEKGHSGLLIYTNDSIVYDVYYISENDVVQYKKIYARDVSMKTDPAIERPQLKVITNAVSIKYILFLPESYEIKEASIK